MANEGWGAGFNAMEDDGSSLAESIVQYAERATTAESKVSDLEGRLAALELAASAMTAPAQQYFAPQTAYNMQPAAQMPPQNVNIPPNWQTQQTGGYKRGGRGYAGGNQRRRTNNYEGGRGGRGQNSGRGKAPQQKYINTLKSHINLLYCYSCGYDVDYDGYHCPPACQKMHHLPQVSRDDAHEW